MTGVPLAVEWKIARLLSRPSTLAPFPRTRTGKRSQAEGWRGGFLNLVITARGQMRKITGGGVMRGHRAGRGSRRT